MSTREEKIEIFGRGYDDLIKALARFPQQMWHFQPTSRVKSIHDTVIHLASTELAAYIGCRRMIAEQSNRPVAYDELNWGRGLHYHEQNVDDALVLIKYLRGATYRLIKSLPDTVWAQIKHSASGSSLDAWLDNYAYHVRHHIDHMQQLMSEWCSMRVDLHA